MTIPYYSQHAASMSVTELNDLALGRGRFRRWLRDLWLRIKCRLTGGHRVVRRRWQKVDDFNDGEWHVGCAKCPLFWIER